MKCGNSDEIIHKDVVIVGNGPSGIALSFMLSGNIPYVTSCNHPDEFLSARLEPVLDHCLVHEDLAHLASGLEGRTTNPVSLLMDNLTHPCADIGLNMESLITWRREGKQFQQFGHNCEIQATRKCNKLKQDGFFKDGLNFNRFRSINETNRRGYNFLRSQKKIDNERKKQLQYPYVIHPFSDFRIYWEAFMGINLLIQFIMIPLDAAAYDIQFPDKFVKTVPFMLIRIITDLISVVDIGVSCITGYCDTKERKVILAPKAILWHYLRTHFLLDLFSSIPFDVILNSKFIYYKNKMSRDALFALHYGSVIKLARLYYFIVYFSNFCETLGLHYVFSRILIAGSCYLLYTHIMTCACMAWLNWQYPWTYETRKTIQSLLYYGKGIRTFKQFYARSFYCATLMLCNSGYGFSATKNASIFFMISAWLTSKLIFICLVARCYGLYLAIQSSSQKYINMITEVEVYMQHKQFPVPLQERILAYYDIRFQNCFFQESEILNTVSGQLRQEIIMNTCKKLVESVTFFRNLPTSLLVRIVSCLRYEIYLTNDLITKAGTFGESMFFVSNGTVAIYSKSGKEICHLHDGDHFGEVALVMNDALRVASVVACEICEVYRLDKRDFVKAIMPYPDLYEKILFVAAERLERTDLIDENNKEQLKPTKKTTRRDTTNIDHIVLGKGPPGGSWHSMDPEILTLSLASWMSLPGLKYGSEKRAAAKDVAKYYINYVKKMGLERNFKNFTVVTGIRPYIECNNKWVEKVKKDVTQKVPLCTRPEPKEKSCTFSSALNYFWNRGKGRRERCSKRLFKPDILEPHNPQCYKMRLFNNNSSICDPYIDCDNFNTPSVPKKNCDDKKIKWIVEVYDVMNKCSLTYTCDNLVLANGSSDLPNRLNVSKGKGDPFWLLHDLRSLEIELDLLLETGAKKIEPVLVVGAGLSAADAIIALRARGIPVIHVFRNAGANLSKQLPENMYPEYHEVHRMMRNEKNCPLYTPLPEYSVTQLEETGRCISLVSKDGEVAKFSVSFAVVLIGSRPDLGFLPDNYNLGLRKQLPIDCKKNTVNINRITHSVNGFDNLYAIGPLAGDNFVRFLPGGAFAMLCDLYKQYNL